MTSQKVFDMGRFIDRKLEWSIRTFGAGSRPVGILDHIRQELEEVERDPGDVFEWADIILLALDGASRAGFSGNEILQALIDKQERNTKRKWPDRSANDLTKATNHVRK